MKQIPLMFALMSGKGKRDYKHVLHGVMKILPTQPSVQKVIIDFKVSLWTALQEELPNISIQDCFFHWTQAVWKRVQVEGLVTAYTHNQDTFTYI